MALLPLIMALGAAAAPAPPADAPPRPWAGADFGGGTVGAVYRPTEADGPTREGSARVSGDGKTVDVYAGVFVKCSDPDEEPFVPATGDGKVGADGTFTATGFEFDEDQLAGAKLSGRLTVKGTYTAAGTVAGTVQVDATVKRGKRRIKCKTS